MKGMLSESREGGRVVEEERGEKSRKRRGSREIRMGRADPRAGLARCSRIGAMGSPICAQSPCWHPLPPARVQHLHT